MKYRLLGPLEIGPEPTTTIKGPQQRALLATLLLNAGRIVVSFDLIAELWPESESPRNSLHAQVTRLRQTLKLPIELRSNGYLINVDPGDIDVTHFHRLRKAADAVQEEDPHEAIATYRKALALWRGSALQDSAIGERCKAAADNLNETRLHTIEQLADLRIKHDDPTAIIGDLQELVRLNPRRETLIARLMAALLDSGRPVDAIKVYVDAQKRFSAELGIDPGQAMREVYLRAIKA